MKHTSVDIYLVIDTFLLLLIGIGPKIALVPFVEITPPLDGSTKALIVRKMLTTAAVVALILLGLGELLSRLLHFSTGSLSIAGGIILIIIAITMVLGNARDPLSRSGLSGRVCDGPRRPRRGARPRRGRIPAGQPGQRTSGRKPHARHREDLRHPAGRARRPTRPRRARQRRRHTPNRSLTFSPPHNRPPMSITKACMCRDLVDSPRHGRTT